MHPPPAPAPPVDGSAPFGTFTSEVLDHGHVRYTVLGRRVRGTFVVHPTDRPDGPVLPACIDVRFGDGIDYARARADEPVVNGVRVHGWTGRINPSDPPALCLRKSYAVALHDSGLTRRLPDQTRVRLEEIVEALVRHWAARPDRVALVTAAAQRHAGDRAAREEGFAETYAAELAENRTAQVQARRAINVLTGLIRRRQPPVRPARAYAVHLAFTDPAGNRLGVLAVRERSVNELAGCVVYDVEGRRIRGSFTIGRERYGKDPLPGGIHASYGRDVNWYARASKDGEPTVNGVRLSGSWTHGGGIGGLSLTQPAQLPAPVRTGSRTTGDAPPATQVRASAVLRALTMHYLSRPDIAALQVAAGKERAELRLRSTRIRLEELHEREVRIVAKIQYHRDRAAQCRALGAAAPEPAESLRVSVLGTR